MVATSKPGLLTRLRNALSPTNAREVACGPNHPAWWDPNHQKWIAECGNEPNELHLNWLNSLSHAAYWRGLNLICDNIAKTPIEPKQGTDPDTSHYAYNLLRWEPNPLQTAYDYWQQVSFHAIHWGNHCSWIERDNNLRPVALWPLMPGSIWPEFKDGELKYVTNRDGTEYREDPRNILHIKGLSRDGIWGLAFWSGVAKEALEAGITTRTFGKRLFTRGANPSGMMQIPNGMFETDEEEQKWKKEIKESVSGLSKSHSMLFLPEGSTYAPISMTSEQAQFLGTRQYSDREVAALLKLPPSSVGVADSVSFNSFEISKQAELDSGIDPWMTTMEHECRRKLLTISQKQGTVYSIKFDRKQLIKVDFKTLRSEVRNDVNSGILTLNQGLQQLDEPQADEDHADEYRMPQNVGFAGDIIQGEESSTEPPPEPQPSTQDLMEAFTEGVSTMAHAVREHLEPSTRDDPEETLELARDIPSASQRNAARFVLMDGAGRALGRVRSQLMAYAKDSSKLCQFADLERTQPHETMSHAMAKPIATAADILETEAPEGLAEQVCCQFLEGLRVSLSASLESLNLDDAPEAMERMLAEAPSATDLATTLFEELSNANQD